MVDLPVRIDPRVPDAPVISVDGAWGAPGLNLSHWPGNKTPRSLRHDLSTGSALAFARLPVADRRRLAEDAVAIVNNHYDTDGVMALFAVRNPAEALVRADAMLAAAAAGDFFQLPNEHGLALDAIVGAVNDSARSPLSGLDELREEERREQVLAHLFDELPRLLDGELDHVRPLWEPVLRRARSDLADLRRASLREVPNADLAVFKASASWTGPGRHALFGTTHRDRVLAIDPAKGGHRYRLILSTLSWFDLEDARLPRPDLTALVRELLALEGCDEGDDVRWRAQGADTPSPEVWYGTDEVDLFVEHNPALLPSKLAPEHVLSAVVRHLEPSRPAGTGP